MLPEVFAFIDRLRHGSHMAVKDVLLLVPDLLACDHLPTRASASVQEDWIPGLFESTSALEGTVVAGLPGEQLLELVAPERFVEPLPAFPHAVLAPEDCYKISPTTGPLLAPTTCESFEITRFPRLVGDPKR